MLPCSSQVDTTMVGIGCGSAADRICDGAFSVAASVEAAGPAGDRPRLLVVCLRRSALPPPRDGSP